jgi:hypothetical protein
MGKAEPGEISARAISKREVMAGAGLLVLVVATDRLGISAGGLNLRLELIVGGLLALWFLLRTRGAVIQRLGVAEYALLGWLAANVLSSLLFSPTPQESLKNAAVIAGVLTIYLLGLMLFTSASVIVWAAVAWVAVGAVVALLGLLSALLYSIVGWTGGVNLERAYRDGVFILTPRVQSTLWEPNIFGSFSITVAILALALSLSPHLSSPAHQRWLRFAAGCAFCGIMLSMTRTVWVVGPLALLALALLALRLNLAGPQRILKGMIIPAVVGTIVGLSVGNFLMPTLNWVRGDPWGLTYRQVEEAVPYLIHGQTPPSGGVPAQAIPTPAPGTAGAKGTAVPGGAGSTFVDKLLEATSPRSASSVQGRLSIFSQAFEGWTRRPILGWGTGSFPAIYPPQQGGVITNDWIANLELHILFDTGLVGFLLFAVAMVTIAMRGLRSLSGATSRWGSTEFVLLGLMVSAGALLLAYQVTDATWLGFTWVLLALLVMSARVAVVPKREATATKDA